MEDLKFVLKCFAFTAVLVILMQVRVSGHSIEAYTFHWLRKSTVSQYIQGAAAGGAMALRNLGSSVKSSVTQAANGFNEGSSERAIR